MGNNENILTCRVNLEWLNSLGSIQRKITYKEASLQLTRNEQKDLYLEVVTQKSSAIRLKLKSINIHNKFISEGKAAIKFNEEKCTILVSNAPTAQLTSFLQKIFVKVAGGKDDKLNTSLRTRLLSNKPNTFDTVSPVSVTDLEKARTKITKSSETTPSPLSRKRKLHSRDSDVKATAAKKLLYSNSPFQTEELTSEQKQVFDACLAGYNVFFTGSAGTGKSLLLKNIIAALPPNVTFATASTGVAACLIGGMTLHQFAGIGDGEVTFQRAYNLASRPAAAQIWRRCKHLIIDEISMINGNYFEKIENVARYVRRSDKPFGGIQLIVCGDFFQLPPISRSKENSKNDKNNEVKFCFQTSAWEQCIKVNIELKQVHRQHDLEFIEILNNARMGIISEEVTEKLKATSKQQIESNGILATQLCSHTKDAQIINESRLNKLPGEERVFEAQDSDLTFSRQLNMLTPASPRLILKIGAQVMLLKNINISLGLVNGARGVVIDFRDCLPVVRFRNIEYVAKQEKWTVKMISGSILIRKQIPLGLAWAFSIHKSQGLTLDCVEMSLRKVFEAGQAYVALSRAQSLDTLRILDFKASQVWANHDVLEFHKRFLTKINEDVFIPLGPKKKRPIIKNNRQIMLGVKR